MTQQEAIKALAEWGYAGEGVDPETTQGWARMEYLRLLSANVAALIQNADAHSTTESQLISTATRLTHATIESLVAGVEEGVACSKT